MEIQQTNASRFSILRTREMRAHCYSLSINGYRPDSRYFGSRCGYRHFQSCRRLFYVVPESGAAL